MRLILTRHGETEENQAGIIQGHLPGKLSRTGLRQAEKVALRLKTEKIDHIYSSDLARAADTARTIAQFHPGTSVTLTVALRERFLGSFQGKTKNDLGWYDENGNTRGIEPVDGEKSDAFYLRAQSFLHAVLETHAQETVLLVGHYGINQALLAVLTGKSAADMGTMGKQLNTSITIIEIDQDRNPTFLLLNCVQHLDPK